MLSSNLVVPVVLWGSNQITHCTSSIFLSQDSRYIATGCYDGQICIWQVDSASARITPSYMLVGHSAPILCLSHASIKPEYNYLVSSSENGEMCLWDLSDSGKCLESTKTKVHTSLQAYQMSGCDDIRLFCNGYYAEIMVMDPFSLETLFCLSSKVNPDWISALHVLRPSKRKDDVALAITTTGTVKVWTLTGNENKASEPIYENESKQIRCLNAITMKCCPHSQRTVLIVCAKYWQIYDAGDFTALCSVTAPVGERWSGGDFVSAVNVMIYSDGGKGYMYKLPPSCMAGGTVAPGQDLPELQCVLKETIEKPLSCPPTMKLMVNFAQRGPRCVLMKGDSDGRITLWNVPDVESSTIPNEVRPTLVASIKDAWEQLDPPAPGILDQLSDVKDDSTKITASCYLPQESKLVVGMDNGLIIIVPAFQMIALQLLYHRKKETPFYQVLSGHQGRVNCLLCPFLIDERYDKTHLVSGGVDFSVCLWDMYSGTLLHRFCIHAGEVTQILAPPSNCSPRILKCICSVASDHSVALLSLQERKCVTLASRHLFPVVTVKWRPLDDFLVIGCTDGTVYIWQMETGHLDRVLHGMSAEEALNACDETTAEGGQYASNNVGESGLANPAVHFFRGLRHKNLTAIKHATQRGIIELQKLHGGQHVDANFVMKNRSSPLMVQGIRTNPQDAESHILFFDIEALVFEMHRGEYAQMVANAQKVALQQQQAKAESSKKISSHLHMGNLEQNKKISGILAKVKDTADNMQSKIQSKVESVIKNINEANKETADGTGKDISHMTTTHVMEVAQLVLSLVHSWGQDQKLDRLCELTLDLQKPKFPISFGILSKGGYLSLLLPTWQNLVPKDKLPNDPSKKTTRIKLLTELFTSHLHWELSATMTSNHLLSMISISNTLMSMNMVSFIEQTLYSANRSFDSDDDREKAIAQRQAELKQSGSQLSTHYCFELPEKIAKNELKHFKKPQVEMLARRWHHHCIEIREAAQQLLLGELKRMGKAGRLSLIEAWAQFLPLYTHTGPIIAPQQQPACAGDAESGSEDEEDEITRKPSSLAELKRKQTTAVVLLGIIGAEFGADMQELTQDPKSGGQNLPRLIAMALAHLLLAPASPKLPAFSALRRAAIDLIGRGFVVWEPYLDVSKVLLGLHEVVCDSHFTTMNPDYNRLPLTPQADAGRTARNSLRLIANARPAAYITTMAREVARYNQAQQNAQALSVPLSQTVLCRAKSEILQCIELLIDKMQPTVTELLIEVTDIILHCVDSNELKTRGLHDVCPAICKYNQVSYCPQSKRMSAGGQNGHVAVYELRQNKCQMIPAHSQPITALAFSPDGKYLVSYASTENRLSFWQTSSGMFGLGSTQTRCVKSYSTTPIPDVARLNPLRLAKLIWISNKIVTLMLADGSETRFNI